MSTSENRSYLANQEKEELEADILMIGARRNILIIIMQRKGKTDFDSFKRRIANQEFESEHELAKETVNFLKTRFEAPSTPWNNLPILIETLTRVAHGLISADRLLFVTGNIVKRVFHIFRTEAKNLGI